VCPGCNHLHGRTVGLEENYYDKGDMLIVERQGKKTP
jgi:hypothetical protein